jgi:signal transduction histidine kinase
MPWLEPWLTVPATHPDAARRRRLLNVLLLGFAALGSLLLIGTAAASLWLEPQRPGLFITGGLAVAGLLLLYWLNRRSHGSWAALLFVGLLVLAISQADTPREVVDGRSLFIFTLPILVSSVVLRPGAAFAVTALVDAVISLLALRHGLLPPIPTLGVFFIFALVAWLAAHSLESALRQLRQVNRDLDQRVAQRTRALRAANARLQELDQLKSRFVSMVSHELRTPLSAIRGFGEILITRAYGPLTDRQIHAITRIMSNADRLLHIVNDLLDQARIEAGQLALHPAPFAPHALIEDLRTTMDVLAQGKGLHLTTTLAPDLPPTLHGDRKRLHQILVNLVNNALKFTDAGEVRVTLAAPDPAHWTLTVQDTGIGIPPDALSTIFEPFRQVDGSATREHAGVGLGLSIVHHLVRLMDGHIAVHSEVGVGSTFVVTLPQAPILEVAP